MSNETTPTTTDDDAAEPALSPAVEAPADALPAVQASVPEPGKVEGNHRLTAIASAASAAAGETRKLWDRYAPSRAELTETLQGLNTKVSSSRQSARRVLDQVTEKISRRLELATVPSTSKFKLGAERLQSMAQQVRVPDLATIRSQAGALADRLHLADLTSGISARLGIGGATEGEKPARKAKAKAKTKAKAPAKRKAAPRKSAAAKSSTAEPESTAPVAAKTPRAPRKRAPRKIAAAPEAPADTADRSAGTSETP